MDAPNMAGKESPPAKSKDPGGYLSALAGGKSPISMPPIPAWMLSTPIYSKLPMLPAPKGKITLYTTGLGEKLYPTPSGLDFDPSAEGLISEYKSLHDPHLKSHYTQPTTFQGLIKKKFITPEGKVICTLKEFNEYHQYLKRVHIEKLAQDRKKTATSELRERERQRQEWSNKEELSAHDKQVLETQIRKRKMLKDQHHRLLQRLEEDAVRHLRVLEEKQTKRSIERARSNLEREKRRNKKLRLELEEHVNRATKRLNLADDESRHAELLSCYRLSVRDRRQLKLEDQWNRHQKIREKHRLERARRHTESQTRMAYNIESRRQSAATQWSKQLSTFESIRDTRALKNQRQEAKIQARLEKKMEVVRKLFEQRRRKQVGRRRRKPPRHGLGGPRHYSTWPVEYALDRIELSPADGVWKIIDDRYLPTAPPTTPPQSPAAFMEPTVTIETKERLPEIERTREDALALITEEESAADVQEDRGYSLSSIELAVLFGDHYDSFIASARDIVGNVLNALEAERRSRGDIAKEPTIVESEVVVPKETKLPEVMRRKSVLQLTNSTVARLVLSNVFSRARLQITAEGDLVQSQITTPTRQVASDTTAAAVTPKSSISKQTSLREMHPSSPITKSGAIPDGFIQPRDETSTKHTSSSLLAAAVVCDALRKVTRDLEQESRRSDTSVLAEDMVWDTIRSVTSQLQKELSENVTRELELESQRSDTSILAEDVVQDAIRNVTSQLRKELSDSGTSLIAERVVSDAIRNAAQQLREMPLRHSSTSLLAEELASTAIRDATRQLQLLLPRSSSSIIAEAIAADAMKNVMRRFGAQPPQTSSSILAQAFAADAMKNATRRLEREQIVRALHPPAHTSSSLLAQAITNDTLQKVTKQLQREREALQPHSSSSLLAQAITNDALANAVRQLERRVHSPQTDSSLLAQVVTREVLQTATVKLQIEKLLQVPHTSRSRLARDITIDALQNAVEQLAAEGTEIRRTSSSSLAEVTADEALQTARGQLRSERANSRCRSRGSRSASPFSPELAKSAINQTSPEPTHGGGKARVVVSDIIKRATPSPTKDVETPPLSSEHCGLMSPGLQLDMGDAAEEVPDDLSCQAQTVVMHIVEGALASFNPPVEEREESKSDEINIDAHRSSLLLAAVNDVFRESATDVYHHQNLHSANSESGESNSEEEAEEGDEIIGVIENEIIAEEESVHSLAECLEGSRVEGLTSVVKKSHDKTIFEGAIIPHDKTHESVTEKVLSVEELHRDKSGHLVHDASSRSIHKVVDSGEYSREPTHDSGHQYSNIVPIYHSHPLNLEEEIIAHNLSAISMKPDVHHKVPSAYSASSRNSFRNMFRPDMTHCQGSAKCLKDTLVKELSHPHHREHEHVYGVLDQPHEDITAHHSDEELMGQEEAGGVCYLPQRKTYKAHEVVDDVVAEEQEPNEVVEVEDEVPTPETPRGSKDTPAGGDYKSPNEEEVEPTLPVSRVSNKSIRSGKSREIQSLHSKAESQEESASTSPRKAPSKAVSSANSKCTTEANVSTQAGASRSLIGAVIERISSIFIRKHSTKIHLGSPADQDADTTSRRHSQSQHRTSTKDDTAIKADTILPLTDSSLVQTQHCDTNETVKESTAITVVEELVTPDKDTHEQEGLENNVQEIPRVIQASTEEKVDTSDVKAISEPDKIECKPPEEKEVPTTPLSPNQPDEQEITVDQSNMDGSKNVEDEEAERETEERELPKAEDTVIQSVEDHNEKYEVIQNGEDPSQPQGQSRYRGPDKLKKGCLKSEPDLIPKKADVRAEQEKAKGEKSHKSCSDSGIKGKTAGKSRTPKPYASLSSSLSKPSKSSSGNMSGRPQPKSLSSASLKPRDHTSSTHSPQAHLENVKLTAHSSQQQGTVTEKPPSPTKPPSESSVSNVDKQRPKVSKPPSTGSVRLIKVSPAPSMSSARRRSGKLSSTSVGKLMTGKASGGAVRLIKVSPAAPTAIGPRRSSRYLDGVRSSSEARVKTSASSCSTSTSNRVQKRSRDDSLSRQASSGSVQSTGQSASHTAKSPQVKGEIQPSVNQADVRASSIPSLGIRSPTKVASPAEKWPVSGYPPGCPDLSRASREASDQNPENVLQDSAQCKPDDKQESDKITEVVRGQEHQEQRKDEAEVKESPEMNIISTNDEGQDVHRQQSETDQRQQLQEGVGVTREGDMEALEDPISPPDDTPPFEPKNSACSSSGSQRPKAGRRSKSIISAVIQRLSKMFSGEARTSKFDAEEKHHSETQIGARRQDATQDNGEGKLRQSHSTGAVLVPRLSSDGKRREVGKQLKKSSEGDEKRTSSGKNSKSKIRSSGSFLAVPPNSGGSDSSAAPSTIPGPVAQISTTHSGEPSQSASLSKQDSGNSNNLPPVEDVEAPAQPPPPQPPPSLVQVLSSPSSDF